MESKKKLSWFLLVWESSLIWSKIYIKKIYFDLQINVCIGINCTI